MRLCNERWTEKKRKKERERGVKVKEQPSVPGKICADQMVEMRVETRLVL